MAALISVFHQLARCFFGAPFTEPGADSRPSLTRLRVSDVFVNEKLPRLVSIFACENRLQLSIEVIAQPKASPFHGPDAVPLSNVRERSRYLRVGAAALATEDHRAGAATALPVAAADTPRSPRFCAKFRVIGEARRHFAEGLHHRSD